MCIRTFIHIDIYIYIYTHKLCMFGLLNEPFVKFKAIYFFPLYNFCEHPFYDDMMLFKN